MTNSFIEHLAKESPDIIYINLYHHVTNFSHVYAFCLQKNLVIFIEWIEELNTILELQNVETVINTLPTWSWDCWS